VLREVDNVRKYNLKKYLKEWVYYDARSSSLY
jgi:hypothetical protein